MQEAGVDPAVVYAFEQTGLMVTEDNERFIPDKDLAEYYAAVEAYREGQGGGGEEP
jgi:hypothetical protein